MISEAQMSYGIIYPIGYEFPWDKDPFFGALDLWWQHVEGYDNPHSKPGPFTKVPDAMAQKYEKYERFWTENYPVPVTLVNVGTIDTPQYVLAVPGSVKTASCKHPIKFEGMFLEGTVDGDKAQAMCELCVRYKIDPEKGEVFVWFLSSFQQ